MFDPLVVRVHYCDGPQLPKGGVPTAQAGACARSSDFDPSQSRSVGGAAGAPVPNAGLLCSVAFAHYMILRAFGESGAAVPRAGSSIFSTFFFRNFPQGCSPMLRLEL